MADTNCVIDIPISMKLDLIWVPVLTSTPIMASKCQHEQKKVSECAVVNESNHHENKVSEVPVIFEDSGVSMSSGRSESSGGTLTHSVSLVSSPSQSSAADSAYGSPFHHAYLHNAFFNGLDDGFWPRPIREDAAPASPNMSDVELLKNTVLCMLLVLMILSFMITVLCTARNYPPIVAGLSLGLIVLAFIFYQFYNTLAVLYTRTRQRANIPLVINNRPRLPQIIAN